MSVRENRPSRRGAIVALAGAGALAAVIASGSIAAAGDHPDRDLIHLGAEYDRLQLVEDTATEHEAACREKYERQLPPRSGILRHQLADHLRFGFPIGPETRSISADPRRCDFYTVDEVSRLRHVPPAFDLDTFAAQKRRVAEITAEFSRWTAECDAVRQSTGLAAAVEAVEAVATARREVVKRIAAIRAITVAGLQVRARILAEIIDVDDVDGSACWDRMMIAAIVRDLAAMTAAPT